MNKNMKRRIKKGKQIKKKKGGEPKKPWRTTTNILEQTKTERKRKHFYRQNWCRLVLYGYIHVIHQKKPNMELWASTELRVMISMGI